MQCDFTIFNILRIVLQHTEPEHRPHSTQIKPSLIYLEKLASSLLPSGRLRELSSLIRTVRHCVIITDIQTPLPFCGEMLNRPPVNPTWSKHLILLFFGIWFSLAHPALCTLGINSWFFFWIFSEMFQRNVHYLFFPPVISWIVGDRYTWGQECSRQVFIVAWSTKRQVWNIALIFAVNIVTETTIEDSSPKDSAW